MGPDSARRAFILANPESSYLRQRKYEMLLNFYCRPDFSVDSTHVGASGT